MARASGESAPSKVHLAPNARLQCLQSIVLESANATKSKKRRKRNAIGYVTLRTAIYEKSVSHEVRKKMAAQLLMCTNHHALRGI